MSIQPKIHRFNPQTNLTYCGYYNWEVVTTQENKETTCNHCKLRLITGQPLRQHRKERS